MTDRSDGFRVAAIQAAPVFADLQASLDKALRLIQQAANRGAQLVAFSESWLPGYPLHTLVSSTTEAWWDCAGDYMAQGVDVPGPETQALCDAARQAGVDLVMGVCERDPITRGTLYSTLLFIGAEGELLARHRKLRPSPHERAVWGDGDAVDMKVHERGYALVSGLAGCEHQMALPTFALAEQGAEVHVAAFSGYEPSSPRRATFFPAQQLLARAFAAQAGCYVLCVGAAMTPAALGEKHGFLSTDGFAGGSVIVDPRGEIIGGPAAGETILYADCLKSSIRSAKVAFDCGGHSARRDQLKLWTPAIQADEDQQMRGEGGYLDGPGGGPGDGSGASPGGLPQGRGEPGG